MFIDISMGIDSRRFGVFLAEFMSIFSALFVLGDLFYIMSEDLAFWIDSFWSRD